MGCEIFYLDHFRKAVAERNAEEVAEKVAELEEMKRESTAALKMLSERIAKRTVDLAFNKITNMPDEAAMERLIRYAGELLRKAEHNLSERQDREIPFFTVDEMKDCEMEIKAYLEEQLEDD